ncbi:caspase domain-containing protein [Diaporthe sp. PMI_573]|nr:caspase domain-containing protein [Diaporthaceae sp. PMI_573]
MKLKRSNITKLFAPNPGTGLDDATPTDSPTYTNIIHALESVKEHAKRDDMVYIHYSGHGARATTVFPRLKQKGAFDDSIVPTDIAGEGHYLRDLELALLLKRMVDKGLLVTVVLDCCHSASATRRPAKAPVQVRGMREVYDSILPEDRPASAQGIEESLSADSLQEPQGYALLAACLPHEYARELPFNGGKPQGALTYWLLDTLRQYPVAAGSYQLLYRRVCTKVHSQFMDQTPVLAGERDCLFFGCDLITPIYSVLVHSVEENVQVGKYLQLAGGRLHGIHKSAEYAVLPLTATTIDAKATELFLATIMVEEVLQATSKAMVKELNDLANLKDPAKHKIEAGCPVVLLSLPFEERFSVRFVSSDVALTQKFKDEWDEHAGNDAWISLTMEKDGDMGGFVVTVNDRKEYEVRNALRQPFPTLVALRPLQVEDAMAMSRLVGRIRHLAQFHMVKKLENPGLTRSMSFRNSFVFDVGKNTTQTTFERLDKRGGMLKARHGDQLVLRFKNLAAEPLNFAVFNLQPLFGIEQIYPMRTGFESVDPEDERLIRVTINAPALLRVFDSTMPAIEDILKVFVAFEPMSLRHLSLPEINVAENRGFRRGGNDPLKMLLKKLAHPKRNMKCNETDFEWQAVDVTIQIS